MSVKLHEPASAPLKSPGDDAWGAYFEAGEKRRQSAGVDVMETVWRRFLFDRFLGGAMRGKLIVDVGCGPAWNVARIIGPLQSEYRYVGIDASEVALRKATLNLPGGAFVRSNLRSLAIKDESADFVLSLGVLMYFDDYPEMARSFVKLLKPGGRLLVHEQVFRLPLWFRRPRIGEPLLGEAPPAKKLTPTVLVDELKRLGTIEEFHLSASPLRTALLALLPRGVPWLSTAVVVLDEQWCRVAWRILPRLGPGHVQLVFRKMA